MFLKNVFLSNQKIINWNQWDTLNTIWIQKTFQKWQHQVLSTMWRNENSDSWGECKWFCHFRDLTAEFCSLWNLTENWYQLRDLRCRSSDCISSAHVHLLINIKSKEALSLTVSSIFLETESPARQIKNLTHTLLLVKSESKQMSRDLKFLIIIIFHILTTCVVFIMK